MRRRGVTALGLANGKRSGVPVTAVMVTLASLASLGLNGARSFSAFGRKRPHIKAEAAGAKRSLSAIRDRLRKEDGTSFVDTHCHLDLVLPRLSEQSHKDAAKAVAKGEEPLPRLRADFLEWRETLQGSERDLEGCVNIGCSARGIDAAVEFLKHDNVYGAFGIHPLNAHEWNSEMEDKIVKLMSRDKVVAWGECGLDYYDKKTRAQKQEQHTRELQRKVFVRQIDLAVSLGKPLVVHTRCAEEDTLELLEAHLPESHPVHVHCFTSSQKLASALLEGFSGLRLGFTGVVTFKNAQEVQEVVKSTPLQRILLETDSPYMAPEPFRGRIAHPGHVSYVADAVACLKGITREEVLAQCRQNTRSTYGI
ncbi:unnamed protein product [Effrenium voratum]|nr:unnamed protein product [Effrenium voratum]